MKRKKKKERLSHPHPFPPPPQSGNWVNDESEPTVKRWDPAPAIPGRHAGRSPCRWLPHRDVIGPDDVHQQLYVSVRQVLGCHLLPAFSPWPQWSLLFCQFEKAQAQNANDYRTELGLQGKERLGNFTRHLPTLCPKVPHGPLKNSLSS